ncbi:MAG: Nramp family divalent metal transporter [Litorimonas sp.]
MLFKRLKDIGPGALIAAAFIGPGTVTACTVAGAQFGYALLWALVFATLATIALQEMAARLGIVTQKGLGQVLRETLSQSHLKWPLFIIIGLALFIGNCAYEGGNLSGAALGVGSIFGDSALIFKLSIIGISAIATLLVLRGNYKIIERLLLSLVMLMAISFLLAFFMVKPDVTAMLKGLFTPSIPDGSLFILIGLIGTTIVPYNIFLHASAVKDKWHNPNDLKAARADTAIAIGLGGLITILIAATAASFALEQIAKGQTVDIKNAGDMAQQFTPLYGQFSAYILAVGLFAAGLTSSITAPFATAYAITEIMGIKDGVRSKPFKVISLIVIASGALIALTGIKPIQIILAAQFANGLLLPIVAAFLLFAMNRKDMLGDYVNGKVANTIGGGIIMITIGLGLRGILRAIGVM